MFEGGGRESVKPRFEGKIRIDAKDLRVPRKRAAVRWKKKIEYAFGMIVRSRSCNAELVVQDEESRVLRTEVGKDGSWKIGRDDISCCWKNVLATGGGEGRGGFFSAKN